MILPQGEKYKLFRIAVRNHRLNNVLWGRLTVALSYLFQVFSKLTFAEVLSPSVQKALHFVLPLWIAPDFIARTDDSEQFLRQAKQQLEQNLLASTMN